VNRDRRFVVADSYLKQFTIVEPARTYPRIVAALSSVVPLCGCGDPTALARKGLWLVKRWRSRIRTLDMAGWELTRNHPAIRSRNGKAAEAKQAVSAKWRMINCRPSAFAARPKTPVCGQRQICPHCWGRKAATTWHTIDAVLFVTRPAPDRQQLVVPRDKVATVLADRKLFPSAPGQAADWDPLQGWADPPDRFPVVRARLIDEPTRRQLASSVGIVYRYPAFYMEAPSRHVLTVLGVTRGRRMMATFGVCRARKAGKILPG
jgi:hypothetical protein